MLDPATVLSDLPPKGWALIHPTKASMRWPSLEGRPYLEYFVDIPVSKNHTKWARHMGRRNVIAQRAANTSLLTAIIVIGVALLTAVTAAGQPHPTLVSVNSAGTGSGNFASGDSNRYSITRDGRYVVFYSEASDLVPL